jgi:hypothetical protein
MLAVAMTMKLASSPVRNSSITTRQPASPKALPESMSVTAASASPGPATITPLPAARPSALTTIGSVPEVAHAGEDHGHAVLVGGGDDLLVAHRAAGLDDRAMPASAAWSMPSRNGKKASEAITEPAHLEARLLGLDGRRCAPS